MYCEYLIINEGFLTNMDLIEGEKGIGKFTGKPLHYKSVLFHRWVWIELNLIFIDYF